MAKAILNSDLINTIFTTVVPVLYQAGIPEDEYEIWQAIDNKYLKHTYNKENLELAIKDLSSKIPNFPDFDFNENEISEEDEAQKITASSTVETESKEVQDETTKVAENDFSRFEHTIIDEEEYQVSVFTQEKSYFADSSLVPTKDMYVRKSTEEEKSASSPIAYQEDINEMASRWGIQRFIKFENLDTYDWSDTNSEHTIEVRVKNGMIFYVGVQVGKVVDEKPVLSTTSIAAKFFKVQDIKIQDAKVDGQDLVILSRQELMKMTDRAMDLEKKLITVVSRLGISLELPSEVMATEAAKLISKYTEEAREKANQLVLEKGKVRQLEATCRKLQEDLSKKPETIVRDSNVIGLTEQPTYIAYYKDNNGNRQYLMLKEAGKKIVEKQTTNFNKAAKLSKKEILEHVIKVGSKYKINFTIAELKIEIQ